jgi:hypothetical protein
VRVQSPHDFGNGAGFTIMRLTTAQAGPGELTERMQPAASSGERFLRRVQGTCCERKNERSFIF